MDETITCVFIDYNFRTIDILVPEFGYTSSNPYYIGWDTIKDEDWIRHLRGKIWWNDSLENDLHKAIESVKKF